MSRYVKSGGVFVELGAADPTQQNPGSLLGDSVELSTSSRTSLAATASATPHAAGTWVEVDPSLSAAASGVYVLNRTNNHVAATNTSTLLEIGIGASGSETVWATIGVGYWETSALFYVPGRIAASTRVSFRVRSVQASKAVSATFSFRPVTGAPFGAPVTYQADTATSHGLILTAPGSLNTKGAWIEMVASTATDLAALGLYIQGADSTNMANSGILIDIGIGAASSETVLIGDVYYQGGANELWQHRSPHTYGLDIPAGSRLSARYARASANNTVDLILVGAPLA